MKKRIRKTFNLDILLRGEDDQYIIKEKEDIEIGTEEDIMILSNVKQKGILFVERIMEKNITLTKPGSISHLLYGEKPSEQSIHIKLGKLGEYLTKEFIQSKPNLELLECGIQKIKDKNKDVDLLFKDENKKIIVYRELKGNIT